MYNAYTRKVLVLLAIFGGWEIAARLADSPLMLPTVGDTFQALLSTIANPNEDGIRLYVWETMKALVSGFALGSVIASILTVLAVNTKIGEDFLAMITSALAPMPAVAVFPIALLIFGISFHSILFISAFASTFPLAISMYAGFRQVSKTLKNVGRNWGMNPLELTIRILIPASLPSIITGLKNGFGNSFRALVACEMVVGAATGAGGIGFFLMQQKQNLEIPAVWAGIIAIMTIGLMFEWVFTQIENRTVKRWGMLAHSQK